MIRMNVKDYSLSKKPGWEAYSNKTWLLVPKLLNSSFWSFVIYGISLNVLYFIYHCGGL